MSLTLHIIGSILLIMLPLIMIAVLLEHEWPHKGSWSDRLAAITRICLSCTATAIGLHLVPRQHKHKVHLAILSIIGWDMIHAGFKIADLGYMMLSLLMEAEETVSDKPRAHRFQNDVFDLASNPLTIPNADLYFNRLVRWLPSQRIKMISWIEAEDDANPPDAQSNAVTYTPRNPKGIRRIALRPGFNSSINLYLLSHELGHAMSMIVPELRALIATDKTVEETGLPCWISPDMITFGDVNHAITRAGEFGAEVTARSLLIRLNVDTAVSDVYLADWTRHGRYQVPTCLAENAEAIAGTLYDVMTGGDHVAKL